MARPEGNVTGIARYRDVEIYGKRLEVFKEAMPNLRSVSDMRHDFQGLD
jgi:hypothetical protein